MNLERQYKLYCLGVDIDPLYKKIFESLEKVFKNLQSIRFDKYSYETYYFNSSNKLIFKTIHHEYTFKDMDDFHIFVRYEGLWQYLKMEYFLNDNDIADIFKFWIDKKYDIEKKYDLKIGKVEKIESEQYLQVEEDYKATLK